MISCPTCGRRVAEDARACPGCGKPDPYDAVLEREAWNHVVREGIAAGRRDEEAGRPWPAASARRGAAGAWELGYRAGREDARRERERPDHGSARRPPDAVGELLPPFVSMLVGAAIFGLAAGDHLRGGWMILAVTVGLILLLGGVLGILEALKKMFGRR